MGQTVVLLAEDEPIVRRVITLTLQRQNFTVLSAGDAIEAIRIFQIHRHVDVLLTDVHMAGDLTGLELAEHVLSERPTTKALVISGFPDSERLAAERGLPFLRKPFLPKDLVARLNELLATSVTTRSEETSRRTTGNRRRSRTLARTGSRAA